MIPSEYHVSLYVDLSKSDPLHTVKEEDQITILQGVFGKVACSVLDYTPIV